MQSLVIFHSVRLLMLLCENSVAGQLLRVSLSRQLARNPLHPPLQSGHLFGLKVPELLTL